MGLVWGNREVLEKGKVEKGMGWVEGEGKWLKKGKGDWELKVE